MPKRWNNRVLEARTSRFEARGAPPARSVNSGRRFSKIDTPFSLPREAGIVHDSPNGALPVKITFVPPTIHQRLVQPPDLLFLIYSSTLRGVIKRPRLDLRFSFLYLLKYYFTNECRICWFYAATLKLQHSKCSGKFEKSSIFFLQIL